MPEWLTRTWAASRRNGGRLRLGTVGGFNLGMGGRLHFGTVGGFMSVRWAASRRYLHYSFIVADFHRIPSPVAKVRKWHKADRTPRRSKAVTYSGVNRLQDLAQGGRLRSPSKPVCCLGTYRVRR